MKAPAKAWLGLGGNLGDPVEAMGKALRAINLRGDTRVLAVSPVYRTPPWGKTDQPWFHNACAAVETELEAEKLLAACLDIEQQLKRQRLERWGPRIIDIDLLVYEGLGTFESPALVLPHPRMLDRAFVLVPLAAIAPELAVNGRPVSQWAERSDRTGMETAIDSADWWKAPDQEQQGGWL
ncbi:MAG: 2-amino-4-hydroxy-6-hydroxymethyldihydropteridine diphosphokinase [Phyllobacterium sp.]